MCPTCQSPFCDPRNHLRGRVVDWDAVLALASDTAACAAIVQRRWPDPLTLTPQATPYWTDGQGVVWERTRPRFPTCPRCEQPYQEAYRARDGREWCPAHFIVAAPALPPTLTQREIRTLQRWHLAYQLRQGLWGVAFDAATARRLCFARFLYQRGRLLP